MVFKRGQKGNPSGLSTQQRRLYRRFYTDIKRTWDKHGIDALEKVATEDPATFVKIAASMMPKDFILRDQTGKIENVNITVLMGELKDIINQVGLDNIQQLPHMKEEIEEATGTADLMPEDAKIVSDDTNRP